MYTYVSGGTVRTMYLTTRAPSPRLRNDLPVVARQSNPRVNVMLVEYMCTSRQMMHRSKDRGYILCHVRRLRTLPGYQIHALFRLPLRCRQRPRWWLMYPSSLVAKKGISVGIQRFFLSFLGGSIFIPALQEGQYGLPGRLGAWKTAPLRGMTGLSICMRRRTAVRLLCLHAAEIGTSRDAVGLLGLPVSLASEMRFRGSHSAPGSLECTATSSTQRQSVRGGAWELREERSGDRKSVV